jgi:twitching motility protein PilT
MAINIRKLLEGLLKHRASDLHLKVGQNPIIRLNGVLRPIDHPKLTQEDTEEANRTMMPERIRPIFEKAGAADYSYGLGPLERFRINAYHQRGTTTLAIRALRADILSLEALNLPPIIAEFAKYRRGLVLVTGITGAGKSSTLSAILNKINKTRREHIITIEDPIEFVYQDEKSIVDQVEVGFDIDDLESAIKNAVRQDPDIIMLGELRDKKTVSAAMHFVETGHLVFSTLHTPDAKQTILRILHFFPEEEHTLVNTQLANSLTAVVCQRLLPTADGSGRMPCCEVLINTNVVQKLIRERRYDDISQLLANEDSGMMAFDASLVRLVKAGHVSEEEALSVAHDPSAFRRALTGRTAGGDRRALIG